MAETTTAKTTRASFAASMSLARLRSVIIAGLKARNIACADSSAGELCSGRRNSMPCAAASHSMARMRVTLVIIGCSRRAAKVAMLT